jgi:hypothetical protein
MISSPLNERERKPSRRTNILLKPRRPLSIQRRRFPLFNIKRDIPRHLLGSMCKTDYSGYPAGTIRSRRCKLR